MRGFLLACGVMALFSATVYFEELFATILMGLTLNYDQI